MKNCPSLVLCCLFLFAVSNVNGRIGFTLSTSQREYGSSGAYAPDNNGVSWKYKGWIITEYYDPQGFCSKIIYTGHSQDFPDRVIFSFLRMNTPAGVTWNEDVVRGPWGSLSRKWRSTEYTTNGLILIHLLAELEPNLSQQNSPREADGTEMITEYSLLLTVSN
jgi:hypothetical protein